MQLEANQTINICSSEQIKSYVSNIAKQINTKFNAFENIHLICILDGAKRFTEDLTLELAKYKKSITISYIKISATTNMQLKPQAKIINTDLLKNNQSDLKTIYILLDDLIDSGKSMTLAKKHLVSLGYKNISTIALLNKYKNIQKADIIGCNLGYIKEELEENGIKDYWLFGYGMDLDGKYRELDSVKSVVLKVL